MVLGFLLYEAADFTWHFGKLIYNGTKSVYDWYYDVPTQDDIEIDKLIILEQKIDKLESFEKAALMDQKAKYKKKINELLGTVPVDEYRLAQEIAVLAEKADITEEIVRCRSHFDQYLSFLHEKEPVGKRLTFLLQETNREINTIGAKNSDIELTNLVIELKNDTEKLREQAQNIL